MATFEHVCKNCKHHSFDSEELIVCPNCSCSEISNIQAQSLDDEFMDEVELEGEVFDDDMDLEEVES